MAGRLALAVDVLARDRASGTIRKFGNEVDRTHKKVSSFTAGMAGGALGAGLVSFAKDSIGAFKEAQHSQAEFQAAFAKFPKLADVNAKALAGYNSELAKKTIYDDDAIGSGQAVLAQFNLTGKQIQKLTPLLLDYASKTGTDLPTAATNLGRAFMGNTRALKNLGINYKSTGNAGKDFTNIQQLLNAKVGGFAEREGKTAAGQAAILKNQYGEIQESVGQQLVPTLNKLGTELLHVIDFTQRNSAVIKPLVLTLGGFAAAVWGVNTAVKAWKATETAFLAVKGLFTAATVAEGTAAATTAGEVTALATAETAAGVSGAAAATGIGAMASAAAAAAAPVAALIAGAAGIAVLGREIYNIGTRSGGDHGNAKYVGYGDNTTPGTNINSYPMSDPLGMLNSKTSSGAQSNADILAGKRYAGRRARGGRIVPHGAYLVGERGPELVTPRHAATVHSARQTRHLFNPNARLDPSQVIDRRVRGYSDRKSLAHMLLKSVLDTSIPTGGGTPQGMGRYYRETPIHVHIDGQKVATVLTQRQKQGMRRGQLAGY